MKRYMAGLLTGGFLILAAAALAVFYFFNFLKQPAPKGKLTPLKVGSAEFEVELATSTLDRMRGLSGRPSLPEGEGMLFVFGTLGNYGFWMKDMNFPLDFVWIRESVVVGTTGNVPPEPGKPVWQLKAYYPPEYVDKVLELNAGDVSRYSIKTGDPVEAASP